MNIVVLCAGISTERDVSIVTGNMVCNALRSKGHNARVLDVFFGTYKSSTMSADNFFEGDYNLEEEINYIKNLSPQVEEIKSSRKTFFGENVIEICMKADIVFMALHGENGENGKVQAAFDLYNIKYTGTGYLGSAIAMDKEMTKQLLLSNGVPAPKGYKIQGIKENYDYIKELSDNGLSFPVVVKPCCGGSSIGVSIANNHKEYMDALNEAAIYENDIIVEEYIKGREFSIGVVKNLAYPIIEIAPIEGFYDYTNKYQAGRTNEQCPAIISEDLTKAMQDLAVKASKILKLDTYCRIDFLTDELDNIYCLEANTLPGMTPTSLLPQEAAVLGMDFASLCERLIEVSK